MVTNIPLTLIRSYKSYEKLCLIAIKEKNLEQFKEYFNELFQLYSKVEDCFSQDTIRHFNYQLYDIHDDEFAQQVLRYMLDSLKEQGIEREVLNTGLSYVKTVFNLGKLDELGDVTKLYNKLASRRAS